MFRLLWPLHTARFAYKNNARLTTVAVDPFNMIELVIDPEGSVRSEPFKDYFTRRKNDADRHPANAADSAYVLVAHQVKYTERSSAFLHIGLIMMTCFNPSASEG